MLMSRNGRITFAPARRRADPCGWQHAVLHDAGQLGEPEPGRDADVPRRRDPDQVRDPALSALGASCPQILLRKNRAAKKSCQVFSTESGPRVSFTAITSWLPASGPSALVVPQRAAARSLLRNSAWDSDAGCAGVIESGCAGRKRRAGGTERQPTMAPTQTLVAVSQRRLAQQPEPPQVWPSLRH